MKRIITLFIICILAFSCKEVNEKVQPDQIIGNWFFIDDKLKYGFEYHEVGIDSTTIHFNLGGQWQTGFGYFLRQDTLFITDADNKSQPLWIIKEIKSDTIIVQQFGDAITPSRKLEYVRLANGEKLAQDYSEQEWKMASDSIEEVLRKDYIRRFNEYQVKTGLTTWEQIQQWEADSSNYISFPITEIVPEE